MFYNIDVLKKFPKIHKKAPGAQSFFSKIVGLQPLFSLSNVDRYIQFFSNIDRHCTN